MSAGDDAELKRLFGLDLDKRVAALEPAIKGNDLNAVRRQAHAIAGAAFLVGERAIGEMAISVWTGTTSAMIENARELYRMCAEYLSVNSSS